MDRLGQGRLAALVVVALTACGREPPRPEPISAATPAEPAAPSEPEPDGIEEGGAAPVAVDRSAWPLPDEILTPWELGLIVMDSHHLTYTQRRQRAFARRKAMMLNPESVTARALEDLAKAAEAGELDPNGASQMVFTARGAPGPKGSPPAGWRPAAGAEDEKGASAPGADASSPGADTSAPGADGSR